MIQVGHRKLIPRFTLGRRDDKEWSAFLIGYHESHQSIVAMMKRAMLIRSRPRFSWL